MTRWVYMFLGVCFSALGFVGLFLPVLPTTPFLILAAGCFARSSKRLESWLLSHAHLGPLLQAWRTHRAIPRHAKWLALMGCCGGFFLFLVAGPQNGVLIFLVAGLVLTGILFVFSRPDADLL